MIAGLVLCRLMPASLVKPAMQINVSFSCSFLHALAVRQTLIITSCQLSETVSRNGIWFNRADAMLLRRYKNPGYFKKYEQSHSINLPPKCHPLISVANVRHKNVEIFQWKTNAAPSPDIHKNRHRQRAGMYIAAACFKDSSRKKRKNTVSAHGWWERSGVEYCPLYLLVYCRVSCRKAGKTLLEVFCRLFGGSP